MIDVLVEGFADDAIALALARAALGERVRLAGPSVAPPEALAVRAVGIRVDAHTDLDRDDEAPHVAYLDVWTPAVAPRVLRLRAAGTRISSLSDLLLREARTPTVGITGSAGKSTTSAFLITLLEAAGIPAHASTRAHAGQLWATEELLPLLVHPADGLLVLELTSSHLAFCAASPHVAVVTCIWPDHVELHGSAEAYVAAKQGIVRHQRPGDHVVVNADDPSALAFLDLTPARRWSFSLVDEVERGAFLRDARVLARWPGGELELGAAPDRAGGRCQALLAALTAALACGADPRRLAGALHAVEAPAHRARLVARRGETDLVDDSLAATARKAVATLGAYPAGSIVAVLGGRRESVEGLVVQSSPDELRMIDEALAVVAGVARSAVVFGPAGASIASALRARGVEVTSAAAVGEAVDRALAEADGAAAVVVSPMFPLGADERSIIAERLRAGARRPGKRA